MECLKRTAIKLDGVKTLFVFKGRQWLFFALA